MTNVDALVDEIRSLRSQVSRLENRGGQAGPNIPGRTVTETEITALAHCTRIVQGVQCDGYAQEQVRAILSVEEHTIGSRGGAGMGDAVSAHVMSVVENSWERLRFADPEDIECPLCGTVRELSRQVRPTLETQIGGEDALLRMRRIGLVFDPTRQQAQASGSRETPLELLQRRFIAGDIEDDEYARKLAVIEPPARSAPPEQSLESKDSKRSEELPTGIRLKPNGRYQAVWRDEAGQHGPTFDSLDEAVQARTAAVGEA